MGAFSECAYYIIIISWGGSSKFVECMTARDIFRIYDLKSRVFYRVSNDQ